MIDHIRAQGLSKAFHGKCAVSSLDFSVFKGEIFGLVGPDGSGKSTTLRMLASILSPSGGDAWVEGLHITRDSEKIKERIGYMSQRFGLYPDLSVEENMDFYASLFETGVDGVRKEQILAFSGLAPFTSRQAGALSGGMKQKLGLACTLIHAPSVLFLDEPTNGVDPVSRRDFWRLLHQLKKEGVTILLSTAYMDEAERCDRIGLMHEGSLLACGRLDEIKAMVTSSILALRCTDSRRAALSLKAAGFQVVAFGDRLHITVDDPENSRAHIKKLLETQGFQILELCFTAPSLEDVFTLAIQ